MSRGGGACLANYLQKIIYMRKAVNLNLEKSVYQEAKRLVPTGQVSSLINSLLKEHVKKLKEQELKEAYQRTAKSKEMREEDKVWEGTIEDGIEDE